MHALAISYYNNSPEFRAISPYSKQLRRNVIERFCCETDVNGLRNGDKRAAMLQPEHIERFMADRADRPESANALRKALRALMKHAVRIKMRADNPMQDIKPLPSRSRKGFHSWEEDEIAQYEERHPIGSMARLAVALGLETGQAKQDVIAMGPQHIRDEVLKWVRKKTERSTGTEVYIEIEPELRNIIDATPSGHLTFLIAPSGAPFTPASFGKWFKAQCIAAGLPHCTFHGLRKACARRMADAGCTPHEIAAITGHASLKEVERYTRAADRKRLARSAKAKLRKRTASA
jgi:integrase